MSTLQFTFLSFLSPSGKQATIDFKPGVNVICGSTDTGKSFAIESIDFLLGARPPLRDIPERAGYDRLSMGLILDGKDRITLERSTQGGNFRLSFGDGIKTETLGATHEQGKQTNLSAWLLSRINLEGKQIRKNKSDETVSFTFRDLVKLAVVREGEIIRESSPFLSGQVVSKTKEESALKLLLTGIDDSGLASSKHAIQRNDQTIGKLEVINQWLHDLQSAFNATDLSRNSVIDQIDKINQTLTNASEALEGTEEEAEKAMNERRLLFAEREKIEYRIAEIHELLGRFQLLEQHYTIDSERLAAIQESGSLFIHQEAAECPLCGAEPENQHIHGECDGNIEPIIQAAEVEIQKINLLTSELRSTISDLQREAIDLTAKLAIANSAYAEISDTIRKKFSPAIGEKRQTYRELIEKKAELVQVLELFDRFAALQKQKADLSRNITGGTRAEKPVMDFSKSVLREFSDEVSRILKSWHFPGKNQVHFDEKSFDFVIDGKPRGSSGKGLRAVTHAAATIALLEFCQKNSLPHPGFVVLDSPLLAYWKPEGQDDDLRGTDLKDRFYDYLIKKHKRNQIIIIENEHPPQELEKKISLTVFTRNPDKGRFGFL